MIAAVNKFENSRQEELTELLMGLPKRERAMCLFNPEILRAKLVDAKAILDSDDDEEQQTPATTTAPKLLEVKAPVPVTPKSNKTAPAKVDASPSTPALSSRGASAAASPAPATPGGGATISGTHTIASLAKLPAAEVIRLANLSNATGLPLPKSDPLVVQATDEFVDSLLDQTVLVQKQKLGDKL
jgi:polyadenylate-binding protein